MGKICCFAGHAELYGAEGLYEKLLSVIEELVLTENTTEFRVGNYGSFDRLSAVAARALKEKYPHLELNLVIPYLTSDINEYKENYYEKFDNILIADIPEKTPRHLMIIKANQYMIKTSDILVCYAGHSFGGAAKTVEFAKKRQIKIINLYE